MITLMKKRVTCYVSRLKLPFSMFRASNQSFYAYPYNVVRWIDIAKIVILSQLTKSLTNFLDYLYYYCIIERYKGMKFSTNTYSSSSTTGRPTTTKL